MKDTTLRELLGDLADACENLDIDSVAAQMAFLAKRINSRIEVVYHGVALAAEPGSSAEEIKRLYLEALRGRNQ